MFRAEWADLSGMRADWELPGYFRRLWIDLKARRYRDPVQKLAYLQEAVNKGTSSRRFRFSWYAALALILFIFVGAKIRTISEVNASHPGEKQFTADSGVLSSPAPLGPVWLVERGPDYEVYSNGLRLESRYLSPNFARFYVIFQNGIPSDRHSKPAGIVFHTSESVQAPLEPGNNGTLTRIGRELLEYVSRNRSYHFLVDRFGRVFRIVPETDVANHAGYSVWADQAGVYINLNHSFLGVSFEAQTRDLNDGCYLSPSQVRSGHMLVEMLVHRYGIPLQNCITHAQVSVDPETMSIGHHTDGAGDFPFGQLGLPDNYAQPVPGLCLFGFDFDSEFLMLAGTRMWKGLLLADQRLRREAAAQHLTIGQHKVVLRERYRASLATLKTLGIIKEN